MRNTCLRIAMGIVVAAGLGAGIALAFGYEQAVRPALLQAFTVR